MKFYTGDIVKTRDGDYKIILYRYFEGYMCKHIFEYLDYNSERYIAQDYLTLVASHDNFESDEERVNYVRIIKALK